ncbi:MAG: hypothetical protein IT161_22715 [Bryobacterales bacterium]|nr:hypothetical protein [Bryobacterales bacterium]
MRVVLFVFALCFPSLTSLAGKIVELQYETGCFSAGSPFCQGEAAVDLDLAKYRILSAEVATDGRLVYSQWMQNRGGQPAEVSIDTFVETYASFAGSGAGCVGFSSDSVTLNPGDNFALGFEAGCQGANLWNPQGINDLKFNVWATFDFAYSAESIQVLEGEYTGWANSVLTLRVEQVPEPATWCICGSGLLAAIFLHRRRRVTGSW